MKRWEYRKCLEIIHKAEPSVLPDFNHCQFLSQIFLGALSFVYFAKALSGSYLKSTITQIERRFDIPSSLVGVIDGSFEIGMCCRNTLWFSENKQTNMMQFVVKNDCMKLLEPLKWSKIHLLKVSMTVSIVTLERTGLIIQAVNRVLDILWFQLHLFLLSFSFSQQSTCPTSVTLCD